MNELYFKAWSAIVKAYESIGDSESAANFQAKREQIQQVIWDKKVESDLKGRNYLFKQIAGSGFIRWSYFKLKIQFFR